MADRPVAEGGKKRTETRSVVRWEGRQRQVREDVLTAEEPLEIRLQGEAVAVVMRTPGDDFDLAAGFLLTEGLIKKPGDIGAVSYCPTAQPPNEANVVEVRLSAGVAVDLDRLRRNFYASSSCGVCGKASIDAIRLQAPVLAGGRAVSLDLLYGLDEKMRAAQRVFERTGSLHAAALFDIEGRLLVLREDVGRHSAVDKVVGSYLRQGVGVPEDSVLMVSGRAGFEVVQKAVMAGIGVLAAVSAPSSLAVELAQEAGIVLVGFLRGEGCNVYAGKERVGVFI